MAHLGSNRVFWTPDGESCDLASGKKSKKLVEIVELTFLAVFERFCMGVLWRGSGANDRSAQELQNGL